MTQQISWSQIQRQQKLKQLKETGKAIAIGLIFLACLIWSGLGNL